MPLKHVLAGSVFAGAMLFGGTLFGGMILGLISTPIIFIGALKSAWIMISSGVLLFAFIMLQRVLLSGFDLRGAD
ncbi:MAG: hypothetical protein ABI459_00820 [Deltaproteobacteria bacterium]